jgi:signal transduction histidine kinase
MYSPPALPLTTTFGLDITRIRDELHRSAVMLASMWLAATLLAWATVWALRATILRPLDRLCAQIECLGPDDLAARLPANLGPDEVRGIVARLNKLLERLHQAFTREQATIANIAHELRTPVAALRSDFEFRLMLATDPQERSMLQQCLQTIIAMQVQVTNLLLLARLESGREVLHSEELDLVALLQDSIDSQQKGRQSPEHTIETELPETLFCQSSSQHLRLVFDNLIGNALAYAQGNQPIKIQVQSTSNGVVLTISNAFNGTLNVEELGKPYYRGDSARHDSAHCGLGLALCLRLSHLLGAQLTFQITEGHFVCSLILPNNLVKQC